MKSRYSGTTALSLLAAALLGASFQSLADQAADDLKAGIDAFNRGDLPGAMSLYEKAAEAGSADAQVRLAYLLDYAQEDEKAVYWYRTAAEQGSPDGIAGLAAMYVTDERFVAYWNVFAGELAPYVQAAIEANAAQVA